MTRYAMGSYQRASGTRGAFAALSADLVSEGHPEIVVNSGDREAASQEAIFRSKFAPSSGPRDVGPFRDRRFWPGHGYWKRVAGGGTVGVPGTSNHEARRAADLAYPYNSDTVAHRRAQVLAKRHNITCEGMGFAEWWHWTYWGPLGTINSPGSSAGNATPEEDDMPDMNEFLNTPAYTGGPTISEFFRNVDQGGVATQVWARTVDRGTDGKIPALQELADAKTILMQMRASQAGLESALTALASAKGLNPEAILQAAQAGVENALRKVSFTAEIE